MRCLQKLILLSTAVILAQRDVSPEKVLMDTILANYSPKARPVINATEPVDVGIGFAFLAVTDLDETGQSMTCQGSLKVSWTDPYLTWNSTEFYDITSIYMSHDQIWRPDIVALNSIAKTFGLIQKQGTLLKLFSNGSVIWEPAAMFQVTCNMDITYFPFDQNSCSVVFGNSDYDADSVKLHLETFPRSSYRYIRPKIRDNSQWEVLGEKSDMVTINSAKFGRFTTYARRRSTNFVMNVIVPSFILAVLNIFVLLIPHELSDVIGVSTTLVLAYTIFLTQITTMTPTNSSQIPFITVVLLVSMCFSAIDVVVSIILLQCISSEPLQPPPFWLLRLTCREGAQQVSNDVLDNCSTEQITRTGDQDKESSKSECLKLWKGVIRVVERGVIIVQSLSVIAMYTSVPTIYRQNKCFNGEV